MLILCLIACSDNGANTPGIDKTSKGYFASKDSDALAPPNTSLDI